jgi:hypothetical protein
VADFWVVLEIERTDYTVEGSGKTYKKFDRQRKSGFGDGKQQSKAAREYSGGVGRRTNKDSW